MSTTEGICSCAEEKRVNNNLTGIKLFKSMVRRVRQKISESKLVKSPSSTEFPPLSKSEGSSFDENSNRNSTRSPTDVSKLFGNMQINDEKPRTCSGYCSDSGTEKSRRNSRVKTCQKVRLRSKSNGRRVEKKPKKILRPPPTYIYVRGLSGIPTQRIRVR